MVGNLNAAKDELSSPLKSVDVETLAYPKVAFQSVPRGRIELFISDDST